MSVYWLDFDDEGETLNGRDGSEWLAWDLFSLSPPSSTGADDNPRPVAARMDRPGLSLARRIEVVAIVLTAAFVAVIIGFACGWRW